MAGFLAFLFFCVVFGAGVLSGLGALIALLGRTRWSWNLGMISIGCFFVHIGLIWIHSPGLNVVDGTCFVLFVTPGLLGIFFNRAPRIRPGHCVHCGYNLTGNTSGICSECGTAIAPVASNQRTEPHD